MWQPMILSPNRFLAANAHSDRCPRNFIAVEDLILLRTGNVAAQICTWLSPLSTSLKRHYNMHAKSLHELHNTGLENNQYCFQVNPRVGKPRIKEAIEYIFDAKVIKVSKGHQPLKIVLSFVVLVMKNALKSYSYTMCCMAEWLVMQRVHSTQRFE